MCGLCIAQPIAEASLCALVYVEGQIGIYVWP